MLYGGDFFIEMDENYLYLAGGKKEKKQYLYSKSIFDHDKLFLLQCTEKKKQPKPLSVVC